MIFSMINFVSFLFGRFMIGSVLSSFVNADDTDGADETHVSLSSIVSEWMSTLYESYGGYFHSHMKQKFHSNPTIKFITPKVKNEIDWMSRKGKFSPVDGDDVLELIKWIETSMKAVGITGIRGYVKTSSKAEELRRGAKLAHSVRRGYYFNRKPMINSIHRKTCVAKFNLMKRSDFNAAKTAFKYHPDRIRAIKCLSKLVGRMKLFWPAWISAKTAPIAKSGLVSLMLNDVVADMGETMDTFLAKYPAASLFLASTVSTFSERKAFTLKSQKQGKLNEYQMRILEIVYAKEPAALRAIALILPIDEVYSKIPEADAVRVYHTSMKWLTLCGMFYQAQFHKGVDKCVRRLGRVPPRGSKINVTAVNNVADAWMNLRRFQTISAKYGKIADAPIILKIMQLVADDQFKWGAGKIDPNAHVYKALTTQKIYPWDAVLNPTSFDTRKALTTLIQECAKAECSVESWLGIAKLRKGEVSAPIDMICGVAVPEMSKACADWLVGMGLFGAHDWAGN